MIDVAAAAAAAADLPLNDLDDMIKQNHTTWPKGSQKFILVSQYFSESVVNTPHYVNMKAKTVCLFYISTSRVNYLTINQQFGHEARENHNGQRQVMSVSG